MRAFTYLLTGLGAGILIGGLFAPRAGDASRKLLARRAQKMKKTATRAVTDGTRYVSRSSAKMRDQAGELLDRGKIVYRAAGKLVHAL